MSTLDRADAWNAQTVLAPFNVSLLVAATQYADLARARATSKPMDAFVREYKAEMQGRVDTGSLKPGALKAAKETCVNGIQIAHSQDSNRRDHDRAPDYVNEHGTRFFAAVIEDHHEMFVRLAKR
jgi:hypothetical protein